MPGHQPTAKDANGRQFACFPVGVLVFIVNEKEQLLLLAPPEKDVTRSTGKAWQIVKGGLEAGESIVEAALRETREEIGADVRVRPLGTVHATVVPQDAVIASMLFAPQGLPS